MTELEKQRKKYELKKAKKRLINTIFLCIIFVGLFICALPWIMSNVVMQYSIDHSNKQVDVVKADKIAENKKRIDKTIDSLGEENYGEVSSIDPNINYNAANIRSVDRVPINQKINLDYLVGKLIIPSVDLNIPVLEGLTNENLDVASGTMKPGQVMGKGNYAIAGHHMIDEDLLFTPLMKAKVKDSIYLTDKDKIYEYIITDVFIVSPSEGRVIDDDQGDEIITLVTCSDPQGTDRLIVRGKFLQAYPFSDAEKVIGQQIQ